MITRFAAGGSLPAGLASVARLSEAGAIRRLQVAGCLGAGRARQILVDVCFPLALAQGVAGPQAAARWLALGGARHGRTALLRERLQAAGVRTWRNGRTQALLDLEAGYCRHGACVVCPVGRLFGQAGRSRGPLPNPNVGVF